MDSSKRPFVLTDKGLDPLLLPALRVQRATESELRIAGDSPWGESLGKRVSRTLLYFGRGDTQQARFYLVVVLAARSSGVGSPILPAVLM